VPVTLHRVGPDKAGPLDSTRTDASGRYRITYTRFGSDEALYFAAAVYRGIAYFSAPLRGERVAGDDAEITVFDTTSRPVRFTVQGHHIVVGAPKENSGAREIVEVYELSNDTTVTVVPKDTLSSIWSAPLPPMATAFAGGPGDISPAALSRSGDRVHLLASFGPGVRQLSYSYTLPERAFPLRLQLGPTVVLEVLLEEPSAQVRGSSLRAMGNVSTQGRSFKRFLSQGTADGEALRIDVPTAAGASLTRVTEAVAATILAAMIGALVFALRRRSRLSTGRVGAPADSSRAEALVAAIAALDARREAGDGALDETTYRERRASLKAELGAALAGEPAPT
jgi:hypothetical protein